MIINPVITYGIAKGIDFSPSTIEQEVAQNVRMIVTTVRGTVPLFRDFGIDVSLIDAPSAMAKAKLTADIIRQVKLFEPRALITKISYRNTAIGQLQPVITLTVKGGS